MRPAATKQATVEEAGLSRGTSGLISIRPLARKLDHEILVLTRPDDQAGWFEEGSGATAQACFSLPVTRVTVAEDGSLVG